MYARKVLLLNASEEVVGLIGWRRATVLLLQGKARAPHAHDDDYEVCTATGVFRLPTVLVLVRYVRIPYKKLAVNKDNVLRRDDYECQYCGKGLSGGTGTIDHVMPVSRGGKHVWTNVVAACVRCNNRKGSRTPDEANLRLRRRPYQPSRYLLVTTAIDLRTHASWSRWMPVERRRAGGDSR